MKINKINQDSKHIIKKQKSFNESFDNNFKQNKKKQDKDNLLKLKNEIEDIGDKISHRQNYNDILMYKNKIKEYINNSLEYLYEINKNSNLWQKKYFIIVEEIDAELKKIIDDFLITEGDNLKIANSIESINGLIVNIKI